jgi:hypothetical protein
MSFDVLDEFDYVCSEKNNTCNLYNVCDKGHWFASRSIARTAKLQQRAAAARISAAAL